MSQTMNQNLVNNNNSNNNHMKLKESDLKTLTNMGFTFEQATRALVDCQNDVHRAANTLLGR